MADCWIGASETTWQSAGLKAKSYTGAQVKITTDDAHSKARILAIDEAAIRADLDAGTVVVVAGFQGVGYFLR